MPIPRLTLLLPVLALLLTTTPAFAGLTWEDRSVTIEAEPGQAVIEASFAFENAGDEPVTITRVTSSCGCTTPAGGWGESASPSMEREQIVAAVF